MKAKRIKQTIQAASMADVAFLLLIFFMIVTTISQDQGIISKLPPIESGKSIEVGKERTMEIFLNQNNIMVNKQEISIVQFNELAQNHLAKQGVKAIFSLKYNRDTNYNNYIAVQNTINTVYTKKRNELAKDKTNGLYSYGEIKEKAKDDESYTLLYQQILTEVPLVLVEDLNFASK